MSNAWQHAAGRRLRQVKLFGLACGTTIVLSASHVGTSESPIADAVMRGDSAGLRVLLKQGADVNAPQGDGMTALHWAASRGDAPATRMLLVAGARVDVLTRNGAYTPLHLAAKGGKADAVKALIAAGAAVNAATSSGGATAIHFAASSGDAATITVLLDGGAAVNAREAAYAQTPLMWAAAANRPAAITTLIKRGADVEAVTRIENIPEQEKKDKAYLVARSRRMAAAKAADAASAATAVATAPSAAKAGGDAGAAAPTGAPKSNVVSATNGAAPTAPVQLAPANRGAGNATGAGAVGANGAIVPDAPTGNSDTRIRPAAGDRGGDRGPSYADLIGNKGGMTALHFAARDGFVDAVKALLDGGAKINHVSEGDHTSPLLVATMNGRFDLAKLMLERGADPKLASDANATPLYAAINVQWAPKTLYPQPVAQQQQSITHVQLMDALIKAGADVNVRLTKHLWYMSYNFDQLSVSTVGATAFWRAAYATDLDAMKLLIKAGADPNIATIKPNGRLPGTEASADDPATGNGKDPSGLDPVPDGGPGVYPIHAASGVGYGESFAANAHRHAPDAWLASIKYLVEELHADVNQRDFNGYTALHHAAARGDNELITYLISKGADPMAVSRRGQTTVDMANGPVQRIPPFEDTMQMLMKMGVKNNNKCKSC